MSLEVKGGIEELIRDRRRLLRLVTKLVGSREAAEDILQSAYLKAVEKSGTVRSPGSVTAWFHRILRNAVADYYRRKRSEGLALADLGHRNGARDEDLRQAVCHCVAIALGRVKREYRRVLLDLEVDGIESTVLARILGITANNFRVRAHRARQALRREILKICGPCAKRLCADCDCLWARPSRRRQAAAGSV
jgi:RNA polymerase sigma-70 factor (ECF subfamily)